MHLQRAIWAGLVALASACALAGAAGATDPPVPVFPAAVSGIPTSLVVGTSFTFTVTVRNDGGTSDDGRICVAFPSFTMSSDSLWVSCTGDGASPGYVEMLSGTVISNAGCVPIGAQYLATEYRDASWLGAAGETHAIQYTVTPQTTGSFAIDIRGTMHRSGGGTCELVTATPGTAPTTVTDQQGFTAGRFVVNVTGPSPSFSGPLSVSATTITLGQGVTISGTVVNGGTGTSEGMMVFSFPGMTGSTDAAVGGFGPSPGVFRQSAAGTSISNSTCQTIPAGYLHTEFAVTSWATGTQPTVTAGVTVVPNAVGTFVYEVRATLRSAGGPCTWVTAVPPTGTLAIDQQGFLVRRNTITVNAPPPPTTPVPVFTNVGPLPASITLGENFTVSVAATNSGTASDDGRIMVGFPSLTSADAARWVDVRGPDDAPGVLVRPAGTAILNSSCQSVTSSYLAVESRDASWPGSSSETNAMSITVQPQAVGAFDIYLRSTMHNSGGATCDWTNGFPSGGTQVLDLGWWVKKYTVQVLAPSTARTEASVSWQRLEPAGDPPPARYGSAAVYDPARDQMPVVAGWWGDCDIYNWTLRFSPTLEWQALPTFVGPGQRTDERWHHSLIYDAQGDRVITYGGACLALKADAMGLDLVNPTLWDRELGTGTPPSAREGHAAIYDPIRRRMLVIGGYDGTSRNDVWSLDLATMVWSQLSPGGQSFPARHDHSAVYDPVRDRVLVFGGEAGGWMADLWELQLSPALEWHALTPAGTPPEARSKHTAVYDPVHDRLVAFAGANATRHSDLWELRLTGTPAWTRLWSTNVGPSNRLLPTAIDDTERDRMIVYGGEVGSNSYSDEVWALTFDQAVIGVPAAGVTRLRLAVASPAATGRLDVRFALPDDGAASLVLFDLGGRCVARREVGAFGAGEHRIDFGGRSLAPGIYLLRLTRGPATVTAKAAVLR